MGTGVLDLPLARNVVGRAHERGSVHEQVTGTGGLPAARAVTVVGLMGRELHPQVHRALQGLRLTLELSDARSLVVARIESACPEIVLVDTDLVGCLTDLCRFARSLRYDVRVVGVACYWSEREEALQDCADAIVHKPPRDSEWGTVLRSLGVLDVNLDQERTPVGV